MTVKQGLIGAGPILDVFFATLDLHQEMATRSREVEFGPVHIPILSPEHLIVCKADFDRPKDWVDIEEIVAWGTEVDETTVLRWIDELLGGEAPSMSVWPVCSDPPDSTPG